MFSGIWSHGAGGLIFQVGQNYKVTMSASLSYVGTHPDMGFDVARALNSNKIPLSHYPDVELISPSSILEMPPSMLRRNKYQFCKSLV